MLSAAAGPPAPAAGSSSPERHPVMRLLTRGPVIALLLGCAVVSCRPDLIATTTRPRISVQPVAQVSPHVVRE